jgi:hypothetical protein
MKGVDTNPLTPALARILVACVTLKTTNAKRLAAHLDRSPATIRTEFQRILAIMDVHCRYAALKRAEEEGWLCALDESPNEAAEMYASAILRPSS